MTTKSSNLTSRVSVAVIAIPALLYISYNGGILFFLLVSAISLLSMKEFYGLAALKGASPQRTAGYAAALLVNLAFFHEQLQSFIVPLFVERGAGIALLTKLQMLITVLFLFLVLTLLIELFRNKGSLFLNAGYTMLGVMYVGLFLGALIGIRELFGNEFPHWLLRKHIDGATGISDSSSHAITYTWGGLTIISIFASIWICDTAAYFGGLAMGKHKLFERVSPNKTWEGALWGFAGAMLTMMAAQKLLIAYLEFHQAIIIGLIIGIFGQLGDLVESLFKRDAGVKDSSNIIPGHGGVFDRFDSLIFVSPILYLYIDFVVLS
jgi:phosphatidate cytidylyltransferase